LESAPTFLRYFVFYGCVGGIVGHLIDKAVSSIQGTQTSRLQSALYYILQILFNGIFFFIAFKTITFKQKDGVLTFDDWVSGTFQGVIFGTTLYSVQNQLAINGKQVFS
jgi:hypothetical protein